MVPKKSSMVDCNDLFVCTDFLAFYNTRDEIKHNQCLQTNDRSKWERNFDELSIYKYYVLVLSKKTNV